ncbi:IgGFc-binding protein-like [Menidia menidia]
MHTSVCWASTTCTVTAPTVIDFHGRLNTVQDRCSYTLLSDSWGSGFEVISSFRERRLESVSFVDSVSLWLNATGTEIRLEQGGRVLVNNSPLTLGTSAQQVYGIQLSKDQTGVKASVSLSGLTGHVFFDGYTAQLYIEVPSGSSLEGLCRDSSTFSTARLSVNGTSSCETVYTDQVDSGISTTTMAERCNVLMEEPFFSCNDVIDPTPYINACKETLTKYSSVDMLRCQFLGAYARACGLDNSNLEGWWSEVNCRKSCQIRIRPLVLKTQFKIITISFCSHP